MNFISRRIAIEFRQPEFPPMRWRGAILTTFVPMPETAVNEEGGFVSGQKDGARIPVVAFSKQRYCGFMPIDFQKFIERNPQVCAGEAVIRGTRVTVRTVLASLAEGASVEEIVADFPTVSREAVRAMIAYAAASAEEDLPVSPLPSLA
jgi:uncharacterized protein (DUF433 family)